MADQTAGFLSPWLRRRRLKMATPFVKGRVLDYGCGVGVLADLCAPGDYLGVDIDEESLLLARKYHPRHRFIFASELGETEKFDAIFALALIEHVKDPLAMLLFWRRALNKGGQIVMTTPHPSWEWIHTLGAKVGVFSKDASEEHEKLLDEKALRALVAEAGLSLVLYKRFLYGANQLIVAKSD
jgi:2-polyprenyl-3-methyl-5-hydroxy-6-metoxy-1,4-benzoquinol methylase